MISGDELLLLDIIRTNANGDNKWATSLDGLCLMMGLSRTQVDETLHSLENNRYIDQFVTSNNPSVAFGITVTKKGLEVDLG